MRLLPVFLVLAAPILARAEETASTSSVSNQGAYLAQVTLGLLVVLALIFVMGWLLRRVGQGNFTGSRHLKIVASLALGTRERIALVQVGEQQLLLGITPNSINNLQTFAEPVIRLDEANPNASDFAQRLKALMPRNNGGDQA